MIVVSLLTYGLGKELGIAGAAREVSHQLVEGTTSERFMHVLPCVRTVRLLRELSDLAVYHGASTTLPKARSRAAHAVLATPDADLWCMIDDDVETDLATLTRLVAIARAGKVAVLPCALRSTLGDHRVNVAWLSSLVTSVGGVSTRAVARGGCGLMLVPRAALERVRDVFRESLSYLDDDGETRVALFQLMLTGDRESRMWLGEDYSFCERIRAAGVEIAAPVEGWSVHDGAVIDLADAAALPGTTT